MKYSLNGNKNMYVINLTVIVTLIVIILRVGI